MKSILTVLVSRARSNWSSPTIAAGARRCCGVAHSRTVILPKGRSAPDPARAYVEQAKFNKPGQAPLRTSTEVDRGCPFDCGLCPEHRQHACLALIEVNTACDLDCPVC